MTPFAVGSGPRQEREEREEGETKNVKRNLIGLALVAACVAVPQWSRAEQGSGSAASPSAERERRRLMRRLGIVVDPATRRADRQVMKKLSRLKWYPERSSGRGIDASIKILGKLPFTWRPVQYDNATRRAMTRMAVDGSYNPLKDGGVHLSEKGYQKRAHSMFWQISSRFSRELGYDPKRRVKNVVVVEGGSADSLNAVTFWNGSIVVHRELMDTADRVGAAVVAASSPDEIVNNLRDVAKGAFSAPAGVDKARAREVADGFIATVIGHEMGHAIKRHGPTGRPRGQSIPLLGIGSPSQRARETICDGAGTDLAMRVGYSPLGIGAVGLYFAMYEATRGFADHSQGSHPAGIDRYRFTYRYMDRRQTRGRILYDSRRRLRDGPEYMTPEMRQAFARLPRPTDVVQVAKQIADQARADQDARRQQQAPPPAAPPSFYPVF